MCVSGILKMRDKILMLLIFQVLKQIGLLVKRNLLVTVVTSSNNSRGNSIRDMGGLNLLAGGLGDVVLNIGTGHLGDSVTVLNLNRDKFDLGVINTMLSGDLMTGMFNCGSDRVSNSSDRVSNSIGSNRSNSSNGGNSSMSIRMGKVLRISLGISLQTFSAVSVHVCVIRISVSVLQLAAGMW